MIFVIVLCCYFFSPFRVCQFSVVVAVIVLFCGQVALFTHFIWFWYVSVVAWNRLTLTHTASTSNYAWWTLLLLDMTWKSVLLYGSERICRLRIHHSVDYYFASDFIGRDTFVFLLWSHTSILIYCTFSGLACFAWLLTTCFVASRLRTHFLYGIQFPFPLSLSLILPVFVCEAWTIVHFLSYLAFSLYLCAALFSILSSSLFLYSSFCSLLFFLSRPDAVREDFSVRLAQVNLYNLVSAKLNMYELMFGTKILISSSRFHRK